MTAPADATEPPASRDEPWHPLAEEPPPLGSVEIRLRSGRTHFAHWHPGRGEWLSTHGVFAATEVEAWRRGPRVR